jgi:hypothetical protein
MTEQDDRAREQREHRNANIFLLVFFVAIIGAGIWLVDAMLKARKADDCIAQGRRNCAPPIDRPER